MEIKASMNTGKIVMGGLADLDALSDAFDSDGVQEDFVMVVRFSTKEEFVQANNKVINGEPIHLEWGFGK